MCPSMSAHTHIDARIHAYSCYDLARHDNLVALISCDTLQLSRHLTASVAAVVAAATALKTGYIVMMPSLFDASTTCPGNRQPMVTPNRHMCVTSFDEVACAGCGSEQSTYTRGVALCSDVRRQFAPTLLFLLTFLGGVWDIAST